MTVEKESHPEFLPPLTQIDGIGAAGAERTADRLARLQIVTAALSRALTPAEVAHVMLNQAVPALDANAGSLMLLTDQDTMYETVGNVGYLKSTVEPWKRFPANLPGAASDAVANNQVIWLGSIEEYLVRYPHLAPTLQDSGFTNSATIPLMFEGRALGVMNLSFHDARALDQEDLAFMRALGDHCAQALERARLYEVEQLARKEAEAAVQARDQFLAAASHELKTPLTTIMGYAALLHGRADKSNLDALERRAVNSIYEQATRLDKLITALLDVSGIQSGMLRLQLAPLDLSSLARRVTEERKPAQRRHTFQFDGPDAPLVVEGDAWRLEEVMQNLIENAIKYSPRGGPIRVEVKRSGQAARVSVSDRGIGIPAAALPTIFDRFYRADNVETWRIHGMGIGLYLVKEIMSLHGGTVGVESQEGSGSTFTISLPLADISLQARPNEEEKGSSL